MPVDPMKDAELVAADAVENRRAPSSALSIWLAGLTAAGSFLIFGVLTAGPAGARLIYGWFLGVSLIRLLPLGALLLGGIAFAVMLRAMGLAPRGQSLASALSGDWRRYAALLIAAAVGLSLAAVWLLRAFPNSGDEAAYLFQAKTFLAGRLWNPLPPVPELFATYRLRFLGAKWLATYPPGWAALLSGGMGLGLPAWLVAPLSGGVLLFALLKLGLRRDGPLGGLLAVGLVAFSPFFVFNAASYFNHVPAAAAGLMFCWAARAFLDRPRVATALLAGLALGVLGLIRPEDAAIFALACGVEFFWRARGRHYRLAPIVGLAGLPFLALLSLYYLAIGGSVLPPGVHTVHFGLSPIDNAGHRLSFTHQLAMALDRIVMLAEWTSPLLVLGVAAAYVHLTQKRRLNFIDLVFPMFVLAYLLVPFDGSNQYGPRYYFEAFPCLVLTLVSGLAPLLTDAARPQKSAGAWLLLWAHGAVSLLVLAFVAWWMHMLVDQRLDLLDQVRAAHLRNAVVVVDASTSVIYPMKPRDLVRNGIDADGSVIYVLDIPELLPKLQQALPQRRFYIYQRNPQNPVGSLRPLRLAGGPAPHD